MKNENGFAPLLIILALAAVVGSGSVAASAANNSVPGEPMYGIDTALESFQVATSFSDTSKAATHLTIAQEKLAELQALQAKGRPAEHLAIAAERLADHQDKAGIRIAAAEGKGKDVDDLKARLEENSARQQQVLADALNRVPEQAQPAIQKAMEASRKGLDTATEQQDRSTGSDNATPQTSGSEHTTGSPHSQ